MTRFELLKFIHVLAAVVWVGGGVIALVLTQRVRRASNEHRLGLAEDMEFVSTRLFAPAAMTTLLFGILMVLDADGISFGDAWILIGLGGVVVSTIIGMGLITPQANALIGDLKAGGDGTGPLSRILQLAVVDNLLLLVVVWAMVFKPGA